MLIQLPTLRSEALTPVRGARTTGSRLAVGLRSPVRRRRPSARAVITLLIVLSLTASGATAAGNLPWLDGARSGGPLDRAEEQAAALEILEAHHYRTFDPAALADAPVAAWSSLLDDPFTRLVPAADVTRRDAAEAAGHVGIGARIRATNDRTVEITAVADDSPADQGGLRPGDQLLSVDGAAVHGLDAEAVAELIEGPEGSVLALSVSRPGAQLSVTVQRGTLKQGTVESRLRRWETGLIGVITVPELIPGAADELRAAVSRLRTQGAEGFVLDLRGNPGGPMAEAVDAAATFLVAGSTVATEVGRRHDPVSFATATQPAEPAAPLVVLVDDLTSGTAEVVAGALADHDRALVAGALTAGQGGLNEVFPLPGGDALQTTYASYVTPLGQAIERNGIPPDIAGPTSPGQVTLPLPPDGTGDVALDAALRAAVTKLPPGGQPATVTG